MKKLIVVFILVMLIVLGIFFWSVAKSDDEAVQSKTLVMDMK